MKILYIIKNVFYLMAILNVVLSGITSGGPVEYSGRTIGDVFPWNQRYLIYLLPLQTTTTTTTVAPCELICTIDCNAVGDCTIDGGIAEIVTTTTTTTL